MHGGSLVRRMTRMYRLTGEERRGGYFDCQSIAQGTFLLVTACSQASLGAVQTV